MLPELAAAVAARAVIVNLPPSLLAPVLPIPLPWVLEETVVLSVEQEQLHLRRPLVLILFFQAIHQTEEVAAEVHQLPQQQEMAVPVGLAAVAQRAPTQARRQEPLEPATLRQPVRHKAITEDKAPGVLLVFLAPEAAARVEQAQIIQAEALLATAGLGLRPALLGRPWSAPEAEAEGRETEPLEQHPGAVALALTLAPGVLGLPIPAAVAAVAAPNRLEVITTAATAAQASSS